MHHSCIRSHPAGAGLHSDSSTASGNLLYLLPKEIRCSEPEWVTGLRKVSVCISRPLRRPPERLVCDPAFTRLMTDSKWERPSELQRHSRWCQMRLAQEHLVR